MRNHDSIKIRKRALAGLSRGATIFAAAQQCCRAGSLLQECSAMKKRAKPLVVCQAGCVKETTLPDGNTYRAARLTPPRPTVSGILQRAKALNPAQREALRERIDADARAEIQREYEGKSNEELVAILLPFL